MLISTIRRLTVGRFDVHMSKTSGVNGIERTLHLLPQIGRALHIKKRKWLECSCVHRHDHVVLADASRASYPTSTGTTRLLLELRGCNRVDEMKVGDSRDHTCFGTGTWAECIQKHVRPRRLACIEAFEDVPTLLFPAYFQLTRRVNKAINNVSVLCMYPPRRCCRRQRRSSVV